MLARTPSKAAPELEIKFQLGAGAAEARVVVSNAASPPASSIASAAPVAVSTVNESFEVRTRSGYRYGD